MASLFDLLHGLTKVEVTGPDGNPAFYNPPETDSGKAPGKNALAFLQGAAKQEQAGVEPSTSVPSNVQIGTQPTLDVGTGNEGTTQPGTPDSGSSATQDSEHPLSFMRPSLRQASTDSLGLQTANSPALTTKGKTLIALLRGGIGALEGSKENNAGAGFQDAIEQPIQMAGQRQALQRGNLENQLTQAQIGNLPWQRAALIAGLQKSQAETGKFSADAAKSTAEAGAIPTKTALEAAQAEAANYKEDPNLGLIDIRTKQPISNAASAPLTADEAATLGKNEGDRVPLKLKNTANEIVNRGIRSVQAGGRSLLVKGFGPNAEKVDMGASTPMAVINAQMAPGQITPDMQKDIDLVGKGQVDLATALSNYRRFPGQANTFLGGIHDQYPNYFQGDYKTAAGVQTKAAESEVPTNIGNQKVAFNTMIDHAELLRKAARALNNGDIKALNAIKNDIKTEFGVPDVTDFNAIANAYNHEVTSVVSKGHITDSEVKTGGATMPSNANFATIDKVLNSYKALAQSKMKNLNKQKSDAVNAVRPNRPGAVQPSGAPAANPHSDLGFVPANQ